MGFDFGGGDEVQFLREGRAGIIKLNRPDALNALNHSMVLAIQKALNAWETDDDVCCVLIEGEGRAFSAGADIVSIYHAHAAGNPAYDFFADEYSLNAYIGRFPKPYISFLSGIVMGAGAGIAVHGSHRIVSENTVFAMPEATIGFFTDVGGGRFLSRLPAAFGVYLALTASHIKWGDCLQLGIATHAIHDEDFIKLRQTIIDVGDPRPALEQLALEPNYETSPEVRSAINECFGTATLEQCIDALQAKAADDHVFARLAVEQMERMSPTSLKVIFRQLQTCKPLGLDDCMIVENRIAHRMLDSYDFYEGIRARLIDKDQSPTWRPAQIKDITDERVDAYFQPLNDDLEING